VLAAHGRWLREGKKGEARARKNGERENKTEAEGRGKSTHDPGVSRD
jgi:hypothetical protein